MIRRIVTRLVSARVRELEASLRQALRAHELAALRATAAECHLEVAESALRHLHGQVADLEAAGREVVHA